ncbi:hypothetical protein H0H87_004660 [Tephrocybe sp. NHM501043]|nr:hypothetical protein H0H87_004660 [Tephrocybe sp. NHM501043]
MALQERTNSMGTATVESGNATRLPILQTTMADQRRMKRYSTAEDELARQFERCQEEVSPHELQIRSLKEATSMLSAHALDARERAEKLRGLLADRGMDPEVYESLKRERWLQEHRQGAANEQRNAVQEQLTLLRSAPPQVQVNGKLSKEERRRQNLAHFLESSAKLPSVRIRKATSILVERPYKRRTLDRVSPMRLRTTSTFQHWRPISLDNWMRRPQHHPSTTPPVPPSLHLVSEADSESPATDTASSYVSTFTADSYLSTPPTTAATLPPSRPAKPESNSENENGTATIYLDTRLSGAQYTPEDIDAPLPDYALDLFSRFDYNIDIKVSNTPPSLPQRSSDVGPQRQVPAQTKATTPSRQSASFLEVPSFTSSRRQNRDRNTSGLAKQTSQRHLGGLFSIPEALSSRIGFDSSEKMARSRGMIPSASPSRSSLASSAVSEEVKVDLPTKIRKRFSILRLGRA